MFGGSVIKRLRSKIWDAERLIMYTVNLVYFIGMQYFIASTDKAPREDGVSSNRATQALAGVMESMQLSCDRLVGYATAGQRGITQDFRTWNLWHNTDTGAGAGSNIRGAFLRFDNDPTSTTRRTTEECYKAAEMDTLKQFDTGITNARLQGVDLNVTVLHAIQRSQGETYSVPTIDFYDNTVSQGGWLTDSTVDVNFVNLLDHVVTTIPTQDRF